MFSKYSLFLVFISLSDFLLVTSQSDTDYACMRKYKNKLSSVYLLGDWFPQYKFSDMLNLPPTPQCTAITFTRPTVKEIQEYKTYYNNESRPFSFDDQPLRYVKDDDLTDGMVMGSTEVKFFVLRPDSKLSHNRHFAHAHRRIDNNYHLFLECDLRGATLWLYSRNRTNSDEELQGVIKRVPELNRKEVQRFCAIEPNIQSP